MIWVKIGIAILSFIIGWNSAIYLPLIYSYIKIKMEKNRFNEYDIIAKNNVGVIFAQQKLRKPNGNDLQNMGIAHIDDFMDIIRGTQGINMDPDAKTTAEIEAEVMEKKVLISRLNLELDFTKKSLPPLERIGEKITIKKIKEIIQQTEDKISFESGYLFGITSKRNNAHKIAKFLNVDVNELISK